MKQPHLITFDEIGARDIGYISVADAMKNISFKIERVYWAYYTPDSIVRGRHAHRNLEQVLIAVGGRILVTTEMPDGKIEMFNLDRPSKGVYLPPYCWHTMQYSHDAAQVVLASAEYNEADYIRDYQEFKSIKAQ